MLQNIHFFSYFARANYDYQGKYLFKASIRKDGSSRFGKANRYGVFPAFSAGWVLSKEDFLSSSNVISLLKLRASWEKQVMPKSVILHLVIYGMQHLISNYQPLNQRNQRARILLGKNQAKQI